MILSKNFISRTHHLGIGHSTGVACMLHGTWGSKRRPTVTRDSVENRADRIDRNDFGVFFERLSEGQSRGLVVTTEAWMKVIDLIDTEDDTFMALELLKTDATIRGEEWDWKTKGYGQLIGQLIATAGRVRAYGIIDRLIEHGEELRINTKSAEFIASAMRKWGSNVDVDQLERLFDIEKTLRGFNSSSACYELFRAYRRAGSVGKVNDLISRVRQDGLELKQDLKDEIQKWLEKKNNR